MKGPSLEAKRQVTLMVLVWLTLLATLVCLAAWGVLS